MKRIMLMTNGLYGGGAEKVLQTVVSHLDRRKYEITLYSLHREELDTTRYRGQLTYRVVFDSYRGTSPVGRAVYGVYEHVRGKLFALLPAAVFYCLFIRGRYDVEVAFIEGESTKIVSGSTNRRSRKLAWVHTDMQANPWSDFLFRGPQDETRHYRKFDRILCVSHGVRKAFLDKYGLEAQRVATCYNPVDCAAIATCEKEATVPEKRAKLRLLSVGRLVAEKGYDRLIRCASTLRDEGLDFEIYILGEGAQRPELEAMIRQAGLEQTVFLPGFQENPYVWMKQSDLMVCASRVEGFSTAMAEGVVLGLPLVSTDCAGIRELVGDAACGMITQNSEAALCDGLRKVLSCPEQLAAYAAQSRKRSRDFSLESSMKTLEELLDG